MRTQEHPMVTEYEIREALQDFLWGEMSLTAFREWLAQETWDLEPGDDAAVLANRIKLKLAEHTSGDLDDAELRVAFKEISEYVSSGGYSQIVSFYGSSNTTIGSGGGTTVTRTQSFASAGR